MKKGKLWGIGVGPGDPQLLTLKAAATIRQCDVIAVPRKDKDKCLALRIAMGAVPELEHMDFVEVHMPMTKDPVELEEGFQAGTEALRRELEQGKTVGFLTLGDPTVYSTYCYLHSRIGELGFETEIIPGITSFCAAAAALNMPLCLGREELHIIPATFGPDDALAYPGVKVLMKNNMQETLRAVREKGLSACMVENCGHPDQKIYRSLEEIPEDAGYYSLMIVKENKK